MIILTIRTDKPEAEIGLYQDNERLAYESWQAHRQLAETIHKKIDGLLKKAKKDMSALDGIVIFRGPGSFTGLRIGFSVANAQSYALNIPIVSAAGEHWQEQGIEKLLDGQSDNPAMPEYGAAAHTTQPRR